MPVRAIRGATSLAADTVDEMDSAVAELLAAMLHRNGLIEADLISMFMTSTPDLTSCFPAAAARKYGLHEVPLMCAVEIDVPGAPQRIVRVMVHAETAIPRSEIQHVFLREAKVLRPDLAEDEDLT